MLFTRTTTSPPVANEIINGVAKHVVDYDDIDDLVAALHGVHTVLSFIQVLSDVNQKSQRNLIDAAILAGVKRFAPSEYGRLVTGSQAKLQWVLNVKQCRHREYAMVGG